MWGGRGWTTRSLSEEEEGKVGSLDLVNTAGQRRAVEDESSGGLPGYCRIRIRCFAEVRTAGTCRGGLAEVSDLLGTCREGARGEPLGACQVDGIARAENKVGMMME